MLQPSVPAWFEIPAQDLERASKFYEAVLDARLLREDQGSIRMAVFPHDRSQPSGALVKGDGYRPAEQGSVIYLNVDDIRPALAKVSKAGGTVLQPATKLPDQGGVFAQIRDSEGNRVGLFSRA
jgi:predicted enzyme related to lactoylglutathione lyase